MACLFCDIVAATVPATICYRDDDILAFDDISPQAPVHKLVIPKKHIATLNDINETDNSLLGHMINTAKTLAKQCNIAADGYRVLLNCNQAGGQAVYHIHLHLLGGRQMTWPPG